jgi:hypothetical protein
MRALARNATQRNATSEDRLSVAAFVGQPVEMPNRLSPCQSIALRSFEPLYARLPLPLTQRRASHQRKRRCSAAVCSLEYPPCSSANYDPLKSSTAFTVPHRSIRYVRCDGDLLGHPVRRMRFVILRVRNETKIGDVELAAVTMRGPGTIGRDHHAENQRS